MSKKTKQTHTQVIVSQRIEKLRSMQSIYIIQKVIWWSDLKMHASICWMNKWMNDGYDMKNAKEDEVEAIVEMHIKHMDKLPSFASC